MKDIKKNSVQLVIAGIVVVLIKNLFPKFLYPINMNGIFNNNTNISKKIQIT